MIRILSLIALGLAASLPGRASPAAAATIGGVDHAPQYDFSEFFAATDRRNFQAMVAGNPFPALADAEMRARLLPVLQANKPRPRLTFTYGPTDTRPSYRLVLVFDAANDLGAARVCNGEARHRPATPGTVHVFAVYCRNDQPLSQAMAWTAATAPEDRRLGRLFTELFLVLFTDQPLRDDRRHFLPFRR
ncbi:MAG: hypothetical protein NTV97_22820 [Alphaproteobacteria bacterium]|nr:hypothetical protein [Alphaproteobacteria bacterium]